MAAGIVATGLYFANENMDLYDKTLHVPTDQGDVEVTVKNKF